MRITWLGHSCFLIQTNDGTRIITDPYTVNERLHYDPVNETADIVTVSHDHSDHNNIKAVKGTPTLIREHGNTTAHNISIKSIPSYHDDVQGEKRGTNLIHIFSADGIRICHLGDIGHMLNDGEAAEIGSVDVLMTPVGGLYTIDAETATNICNKLKPKVIIPMHFSTAKLDFPIATEKDFVSNKNNVRRLDSSGIEITRETLPLATEIIVLQYAR